MKTACPEDLIRQVPPGRRPPVEQWNPPLSGDMDLRIARDGAWYHQGRAIQRKRLVQLFASILRRDDDGDYYLVTPVEKWRIEVEVAPFVAIFLDVTGAGRQQLLRFQTNVNEAVDAGPEHDIRMAGDRDRPLPFVHVRGRLQALISRSVFLELAEYAEPGEHHGEVCLGVWSQAVFFPLGPLEES